MPTWLNSQKKARLAELAEMCNMGTPAELAEWRKDQLVPALEHILSSNPAQFNKLAAFDEYYQRRNSPVKRGGNTRGASVQAINGVLGSVRPVPSRAYEMKNESEVDSSLSSPGGDERSHPTLPQAEPPAISAPLSSPSLTSAAIRRPLTTTTYKRPTPATASAVAPVHSPITSPAVGSTSAISRPTPRVQEIQNSLAAAPAPLPPSPAAVTDFIEAETARYNATIGEVLHLNRIFELFDLARLELSSMIFIHLLILGVEFYYLQSHVAVWRYAFDINTGFYSMAIYYPDIFVYLSGYWLSMAATWQALSFWIPLTVSWFCNLSLKLKNKNGVEYWRPRYTVDPLTFALTKGLVAWLVFVKGSRFLGFLSDETAARVEISMPGGFSGVAITSSIGMILAIWDAIQGKKGF